MLFRCAVVVTIAALAAPGTAFAIDTNVTEGPGAGSTTTSAVESFTFQASGASGTPRFECRLDSGSWQACSSPKGYDHLSTSTTTPHTFDVRACDSGGCDSTPASRSWFVDAESRYDAIRPRISESSGIQVFESVDPTLVPGDTNGTWDIYLSMARGHYRVSVASDGTQANGPSFAARIDQSGQRIAFMSNATNLVPGDTNGKTDVFVHDVETRETKRVSVGWFGEELPVGGEEVDIADWGRYIAFSTYQNFAGGTDGNNTYDVYVYDYEQGKIVDRVSGTSAPGRPAGNSWAMQPSISADGTVVAFRAAATDYGPADVNGHPDVYVHNRATRQTVLASVSTAGQQANADSAVPDLSADARVVAFDSAATNLASVDRRTGQPDLDTNGVRDVFVRAVWGGPQNTTVRASLGWDAANGDAKVEGTADSTRPVVSATGEYTTYQTNAGLHKVGDTNAKTDVYQWKWGDGIAEGAGDAGRMALLSVGFPHHDTASNGNSQRPAVSPDGEHTVFSADGSDVFSDGQDAHTADLVVQRWSGGVPFAKAPTGGACITGGNGPSGPNRGDEKNGKWPDWRDCAIDALLPALQVAVEERDYCEAMGRPEAYCDIVGHSVAMRYWEYYTCTCFVDRVGLEDLCVDPGREWPEEL